MKREEIISVLERLSEVNEENKGMQPELTLGCFISRNSEENSYCTQCKVYELCQRYLKYFEER